MSVEEENKAVVNWALEAINSKDFDTIDEIYVAATDPQGLKDALTEIYRAFPDYHGTNVIQVAEGDFVANRFVGMAPT